MKCNVFCYETYYIIYHYLLSTLHQVNYLIIILQYRTTFKIKLGKTKCDKNLLKVANCLFNIYRNKKDFGAWSILTG